MAYALIPDGYSLKKVTKLQKRAVDAKRQHDNVEALLANDNTPLVIGGIITGIFAANVARDIIEDLENTVGPIAEKTKVAIKETVEIRLSRPAMIREAIGKGLSAFPSFTEFREAVRP